MQNRLESAQEIHQRSEKSHKSKNNYQSIGSPTTKNFLGPRNISQKVLKLNSVPQKQKSYCNSCNENKVSVHESIIKSWQKKSTLLEFTSYRLFSASYSSCLSSQIPTKIYLSRNFLSRSFLKWKTTLF
jgi:hypothetical protein